MVCSASSNLFLLFCWHHNFNGSHGDVDHKPPFSETPMVFIHALTCVRRQCRKNTNVPLVLSVTLVVTIVTINTFFHFLKLFR
ncbi:uncharacterized protein BYT42DRAFT_563084 [Radiomyces spectabilis]|uniref:uncharacterized protein n=1 Tax=Radiomyces spectabilis TaxID=64574 RepID=UPI00221F7D3A|nr:uncharacterized protein BYT42DRAFT_563084 [Radiomyces spectabilis]KAI8384615.1 hypothetical protein BYT42DRAFT_563084 [Radiomyces spectabilis]